MNSDPSQSEREFIDYRFTQLDKRLERMEQTMNGFAFVKQTDFDDFAKEVREKYVTKESQRWVQNTVGGIAIGVGITLVVALIKLIGGNL
jgi:hypothetical protein